MNCVLSKGASCASGGRPRTGPGNRSRTCPFYSTETSGRRGPVQRRSTLPKTIYALSDVHGHVQCLLAALDAINLAGDPDAHLVLLGDYIDRGLTARRYSTL